MIGCSFITVDKKWQNKCKKEKQQQKHKYKNKTEKYVFVLSAISLLNLTCIKISWHELDIYKNCLEIYNGVIKSQITQINADFFNDKSYFCSPDGKMAKLNWSRRNLAS